MNKSETKAYDWLKSQGYTNINFSARRTPDFMSATGEAFEVKRRYGNTVVFTRGQFEKIHRSDATVLVMEDGKDEPIAQIPANEVSEGTIHGDLRMTIPENHRNTQKVTAYISEDLNTRMWTHINLSSQGSSTYGAVSNFVSNAFTNYLAEPHHTEFMKDRYTPKKEENK